MNESYLMSTCAISRTAYYLHIMTGHFLIITNYWSCSAKMGLTLAIILHSRHSTAQMTNHIGSEMHKKICHRIQATEGQILILTDESTSLGCKTTLIVYLERETDKSCEPHFMYLDLIELPNQRANTIMQYPVEMPHRMFTTASGLGATSQAESEYIHLIEQLNVLERDNWPQAQNIPPAFGEVEISEPWNRFGLPTVQCN